MCWSQQLYDAMIHVYNYGMHDYTTPLLELLLQLRRTLKKGRSISGEHTPPNKPSFVSPVSVTTPSRNADVYLSIGNKLLVYIRYSFSSVSYQVQ